MDMIDVCPACDGTDFERNNGGMQGPDAEARYACRCGARFDDPDERERKGPGSVHGLARKLLEADS